MRRMSWLAVAAVAMGGCTSSSTVWVHPERSETELQADLTACRNTAEKTFDSEESQALVHGDFDTYGNLRNERDGMVAECMTGRGWTARTITAGGPETPEPPAVPAMGADAPPPQAATTQSAGTRATPGPKAPAPAAAPVSPPGGAGTPVAPPVAAEAPVAVEPAAPEAAATTQPPAPAAPRPRSGSERSADLAACEAEAEAAVDEAIGDALSHGDLGAYERLRARKAGIVEGCMIARGWRDGPGE